NENGFKIYAGQGATAPSTMCYQAPINATAWSQICSINTQYAFQVSAFNSGGESAKTSNLAKYTLIENVLGLNFSNVTNISIDVAATNTPSNLASGSSGLYFANATMSTNSGWKRNNNAWSSTGLSPNVQYAFYGQSRNGDGAVTPAFPDKKYTLCNVPTMPIVSRPTASTLDVTIGPGDGNPAYTVYCIEIVQSPPGISGYVQMNGTVGAAPVYMIATAWGTKCVGPLPSSSTFLIYTFAQNGEGVLAGPSPLAMGTTNAAGASPSPPANPGSTNIGTDSLRWTWVDTSLNEIGFTVFTCTGVGEPSDLHLTPPNTEHLDIGGLSPNTAYSMQVAAYNNEGPSPKTIIFTKYTLANTPVAPNVGSPTETTLDVSIGSGDGNTTWTLYAIQVSPSVGGNTWVQANGTVGASAVYQTASDWGVVTVQGLSSSTIYSFAVIARNGDGTDTAAGTGGSGTTLAAGSLPTAAPSNAGATNISTSAIRWTWNDNSSNETGFKVYAGSGATAPVTVTHATSANATFWDHSGLTPNSQYAMQVSATNANGDTAKTTNIAKYTAIEQVSGLTFSGVTSTSIGASSTNTPSNLGVGSSGLQFAITSPIALSSPWQQNNTPYSFNGLSPNTAYTFSGGSRNGDSMASSVFSGSIKYTLANTPGAPILSNPSINSIDVSLDSYDGNSPATLYAIQISPSVGGNSWVQSSGALGVSPVYQTASVWGTKTVTGLALFTSYAFTATAQNGESILAGPGTGATLSTLPNPPTAPSSPSATFITPSSIVWNWLDNSGDETGFKVFAGSGLTAPSTLTFTTGVNALFWVHETLSPNAPYTMQVSATNTGGDSPKTASLTKYTLANAPKQPIISNVASFTVDFQIDATDGNPVITTYAVNLDPDVYGNTWVQSNGALGASPFYQTASAWGVKTIIGLLPSRPYSIRAISHNQDGADNEGAANVFYAQDLTRANDSWNAYR
ncbi:fibronectin type III domain-containing protein, partial [Candidatus Sumerlaeota bacterium]|nr:fibronectin type III domain-containing protein [Candidatus Sumerlaeota bacterium]